MKEKKSDIDRLVDDLASTDDNVRNVAQSMLETLLSDEEE
tara:strand:+ start:4113 stop:4232 length:120 start_codon:yes stop_codon:yes gene_type:complete